MEQFQKYNTIDKYGAKLRIYQDQLANISEMQLSDNKLIIQLCKGLLPHYDDIVRAIRVNMSKMTFNQALKLLIYRECILGARRQSKALIASKKKTQAQALAANTDNADNGKNNQQVASWFVDMR